MDKAASSTLTQAHGPVLAGSLGRTWRRLATGFCFVCFGVGGLLMHIVLFPLISLLVRDPKRHAHIARQIIRVTWCGFVEMMRVLNILSYEWQGRERLQRDGMLILANHPSLLDVVFLVAHIPNTDCVIKAPLFRNLFTGGPVRAARYICNEDAEGLMTDCIASIRSGYNLIIFPEGTRTRPGQPLQLQRGAANIAVRGKLNITPVIINCDPPMLVKGDWWYNTPARRPHYIFRVADDIAIQPFLDTAGSEALAARHLTDSLQNYFSVETSRHAGA